MSSSSTETYVDINMPQMGVSVAEGTVVEWKKQVGDWVQADEIIASISTDKIDTDVESPASGRVAEIVVQVGETVDVGTVMARIAREGEDLTVIAYGAMVHAALEATEDLDGASIEVLDLRSLVPLDEAAILKSVRKTSKVVIIDEANQTCAAGAQVAALIAERAWEDLDGPVVRVATPDVPIPFSPPLEQALLPSVDRVKEAARELLEY